MKIFEECISLDYDSLNSGLPAEPARLVSYIDDDPYSGRKGAVIVCPGGGYCDLAYHEGEPVAMQFTAAGYQSFVLHYSRKPVKFPAALLELSKAVAHVREKADEYNIDSNRIFVLGFSAGGHLAGSLGVFWKEAFVQRFLGYNNDENQPNGLILCYPVISSNPEIYHKGSFEALLGEDYDNISARQVSLEEQVSGLTPPTFLWHTFADGGVDVRNSLVFAQQMKKYDIRTELHIFPEGNHGLGLAKTAKGEIAACKDWINLAIRFLDNINKGA